MLAILENREDSDFLHPPVQQRLSECVDYALFTPAGVKSGCVLQSHDSSSVECKTVPNAKQLHVEIRSVAR